MILRFKDGKEKAFTLSYDDGIVQDIKMIDILNKYRLKATFNISTGLLIPEDTVREKFYGRLKESEAKELYSNSGHEVALHGLKHQNLDRLTHTEAIREIIEDKKNIERIFGGIARGFAYPYGTFSDEAVNHLRACGICYARTIIASHRFDIPTEWLNLQPTCHHNDPMLFELLDRFVTEKVYNDWLSRLFYLWGHSSEFEHDDNWDVLEKVGEMVGNRDDVWYATNIEIYDYVTAANSIYFSYDGMVITNPTSTDVWMQEKDEVFVIKAGQTLIRK